MRDPNSPGGQWLTRVLELYEFEVPDEVERIADLIDLRARILDEVVALPNLTSTGSMRQTVTHPHVDTIRQLTITIAKLSREAGIAEESGDSPSPTRSATAASDAARAMNTVRWGRR